MLPLQIKVLVALPDNTKLSLTASQICSAVYGSECTVISDESVRLIIHELILLGLAKSAFVINPCYRRTPAGDAAVAALQDWEAV